MRSIHGFELGNEKIPIKNHISIRNLEHNIENDGLSEKRKNKRNRILRIANRGIV